MLNIVHLDNVMVVYYAGKSRNHFVFLQVERNIESKSPN